MYSIDEFVTTAENARIAWITVARHFQLLSMHGWTDESLAKALGVRPSMLRESAAAFEQLVSPDVTRAIRF